MKSLSGLLLLLTCLVCCKQKNNTNIPLLGTWQLITGTTITKGDTIVTRYDKNISFIKIINDTHFAFLQHDLNNGKDSTAVYVSGGGTYSISDSTYTEHLAYCSDRNWEGNDFKFIITIKNDTLVQTGVEKVSAAGINRINIERYSRVKNNEVTRYPW